MFTGITEQFAEVIALKKEGSNLHITFRSPIGVELNIDQSVSHNGVCLTVVQLNGEEYNVTAIKETLEKTTLSELKIGDKVNIERCIQLGSRIDGHMVQGHIDQIGKCIDIKEEGGSYLFTFKYKKSNNITVEKGSICINGVSLTVINSQKDSFSVAIIPYTYQHTNFHMISLGDNVNIEFDILGKYVSKMFLENL